MNTYVNSNDSVTLTEQIEMYNSTLHHHFKMDDNGTRPLVLVCVDGSEHSDRAFNWFHQYFYRREYIIGIVYIYTYPDACKGPNNAECQRELQEVLMRNASTTRKFEEYCAQRGMASLVFTEEKIHSVGYTICKVANENPAMCIVMGQRGIGPLQRAMSGSVSDYVLHHASIPVLVVNSQQDH